jgi:hypothetical protein
MHSTTHIDYIGTKCADCEEADVAKAAEEAEVNRKAEGEKNALALLEKSKETEEEHWEKAIDDFLVYAEANGRVISER